MLVFKKYEILAMYFLSWTYNECLDWMTDLKHTDSAW